MMYRRFIESKINDIAKYFVDKQPENITFIDADTYDYELFTLYEKWKQLVPAEEFVDYFPYIDKLWELLANWKPDDVESIQTQRQIIELAKKHLTKTIKNNNFMKKQEILNGISRELEGLSSENPRDFYFGIDCYADNYDEDSIGALIYKWEQFGFGDFKKKFPITSRLYVQLENMNDGIERLREEYAALISLAKDALAEIKGFKAFD
ncbi:hypothetical protein EUA77_02880 [TM7 phylum sp. oral taxon 351]|nr:hypothetical protein EUA77_02880 [TM7 phylum sp. oral taxon 351]